MKKKTVLFILKLKTLNGHYFNNLLKTNNFVKWGDREKIIR